MNENYFYFPKEIIIIIINTVETFFIITVIFKFSVFV